MKTSEIPLNEEMMLTITISSHDEQHTYKRALVHAGNSWGAYRQQLLIIDRDFDGIEDLYDNDVSESYIASKYEEYKSKYGDMKTMKLHTTIHITLFLLLMMR